MAHCVNGHETQTEDFCDKCGMPVLPDPPPPEPKPETCPHCGALRLNNSLFCESCGYDYTTGAIPQQDLRTELGLPPSPGESDAVKTSDSAISDNSSTLRESAQESTDSPSGKPTPPATSDSPQGSTRIDPDAHHPPSSTPTVSAKSHIPWVAEVWIDPQWYAFQESTDPMPPQGPPRIVPLKESALIGRHSASRNINPDIDCEPDTGCSRRQAYLTSADGYWYINDLESANGTFVADATASLPDDPITTRTQITPDMRIYVGAWTRIVVRPAIEQELQS